MIQQLLDTLVLLQHALFLIHLTLSSYIIRDPCQPHTQPTLHLIISSLFLIFLCRPSISKVPPHFFSSPLLSPRQLRHIFHSLVRLFHDIASFLVNYLTTPLSFPHRMILDIPLCYIYLVDRGGP